MKNIPAAEVYQIGFDRRNPYFVYCGLQDNGAWSGPSASLDSRAIINDHWIKIGGGNGFYTQVDPADSNKVYANSQKNGLYRYNLNIKIAKSIKPIASIKEPPYRFNWNSPIHISPHDSKTIYTGGNYLFRSTDAGRSWEIISPDLTTDDPKKQIDSGGPITLENTGAEFHCTANYQLSFCRSYRATWGKRQKINWLNLLFGQPRSCHSSSRHQCREHQVLHELPMLEKRS